MQFHLHSLLSLLLLLPTLSLTQSTNPQKTTTTTITFTLPNSLPPSTLSAQTSLLLTTTSKQFSSLLTKSGVFTLHNVSVGESYLAEVISREWIFAPMRIDISSFAEEEDQGKLPLVEASLTFRGHPWSNMATKQKGNRIELVPIKQAEYYSVREGFSPMKLLGSPMILLAVVSLGGMYFVPKLIDNMDPELKAEFQEAQKRTLATQAGITGALSGGGNGASGSGKGPAEGFDLASYLSGSGSGSGNGGGNGGGKKK